ncbi:MAG: rhodanese-like domain-containing protein, partial [Alphaproteobacteria bacterium]|nr:rhodanese-like domain-containing protein [Alphaproteobacteria bacterium]
MIFGFGKARHRDISAPELAQMLNMGSVQIVDVREAHEFAAGHIPDAINLPLSQFRPSQLPEARGRTLVLNCLGGK